MFNFVRYKAYKYVECESEDQKVKLSDVQVLTLYRDQFTTGRRLPGVAQVNQLQIYDNANFS